MKILSLLLPIVTFFIILFCISQFYVQVTSPEKEACINQANMYQIPCHIPSMEGINSYRCQCHAIAYSGRIIFDLYQMEE